MASSRNDGTTQKAAVSKHKIIKLIPSTHTQTGGCENTLGRQHRRSPEAASTSWGEPPPGTHSGLWATAVWAASADPGAPGAEEEVPSLPDAPPPGGRALAPSLPLLQAAAGTSLG